MGLPYRATIARETDAAAITQGVLARVLQDRGVTDAFMHWMNAEDFKWFTQSLPVLLGWLAERRNAAAHREHVDRDAALEIRDRTLGVGSEGELARLGKVRIS